MKTLNKLKSGLENLRKKPVVWCTDLGSSKACTVVYQLRENRGPVPIDMVRHPLHGVQRGVVVDAEALSLGLKGLFEEVRIRNPFRLTGLICGIGGSYLKSQVHESSIWLPRNKGIAVREISRAVEVAVDGIFTEDQTVIHAIPQRYILDGITETSVAPIGLIGETLKVQVLLVAGFSAPVQNLIKTLKKARAVVSDFALNILACSEVVLTENEKKIGAVVVDVGAGITDLAIFHQGEVLCTKTLPMGGNLITRDLASLFSASEEEAEEIKQRCGCALPASVEESDVIELRGRKIPVRKVAEVIQCRLNDIVLSVTREIESTIPKSLLSAGIFLAGGTSNLKGIEEFFSEVTGLTTRKAVARVPEVGDVKIHDPACFASLGLIRFCRTRVQQNPLGTVYSKMRDFNSYIHGDRQLTRNKGA